MKHQKNILYARVVFRTKKKLLVEKGYNFEQLLFLLSVLSICSVNCIGSDKRENPPKTEIVTNSIQN